MLHLPSSGLSGTMDVGLIASGKGPRNNSPGVHYHSSSDLWESVLSTWETSFCAIATQGPLASRLLDLLAFVDYDDVFLALFDPSQEWRKAVLVHVITQICQDYSTHNS